ncbi:MAG TPA: hypothetical protein VMT63_07885 [Bacteroidales bacterium]|nr:hypothetical protein [Bacteroidales bacterium]
MFYKQHYVNSHFASAEVRNSLILFLVSALEASVVFVPVGLILFILILINRNKVVLYSVPVISGSMIGAAAGFLAGHLVLSSGNDRYIAAIQYIIEHSPGFSVSNYHKVDAYLRTWGCWILFPARFSGLPLGLFSVSAGIANLNNLSFVITVFLSGFIKFSLLGYAAEKMSLYFENKREINFISGTMQQPTGS